MDLYLIIFTSGNYRKEQVYESHKDLFVALENHFTLHLINYKDADTIPSNSYKMAFIASGQVEDKVISNFSIFPYPITLLTDGLNNSLAAAMEIAAWIRSKDMKVQIIHGRTQEMVSQVLQHHQAFQARHYLKGKRISVVGTPSSWLVACHVDYLLASKRWGVTYVDIPIEEVYKLYNQITDDEVGVEASLFATRAQACQDTTPEILLQEMRLYKAVKTICKEEKLDAVTLSGALLTEELQLTGCLASSLLNNEGIPSGCEGDLQAIMTLLMAKALTGQTCFMGNPAFIDTQNNELLLAHCSIPTSMTDSYIIRDHFEAATGIGIQGIVHPGDVTIFRCGGECLDEYFVTEGYLTENMNLLTACRTQLRIKLDKPVSYFLKNPLGNHHVMLLGKHAQAIQEFMQQNRCKLRE